MFFAGFLMDFPWVWPRRLCPRCPAGDHRSRPRLEEAGVDGTSGPASARAGWIGSLWKNYDKHPDHYKMWSPTVRKPPDVDVCSRYVMIFHDLYLHDGNVWEP